MMSFQITKKTMVVPGKLIETKQEVFDVGFSGMKNK